MSEEPDDIGWDARPALDMPPLQPVTESIQIGEHMYEVRGYAPSKPTQKGSKK